MFPPMTPEQCRAARALLDITQSKLAHEAGLGLSNVVDFEKRRRPVSNDAIKAMQNALQRAGIAFNQRGVEIALTFQALAEGEPPFRELTHVGYKATKNGVNMLSVSQISAARALLKWSAPDLTRKSALGVNTIRRAENAEEG